MSSRMPKTQLPGWKPAEASRNGGADALRTFEIPDRRDFIAVLSKSGKRGIGVLWDAIEEVWQDLGRLCDSLDDAACGVEEFLCDNLDTRDAPPYVRRGKHGLIGTLFTEARLAKMACCRLAHLIGVNAGIEEDLYPTALKIAALGEAKTAPERESMKPAAIGQRRRIQGAADPLGGPPPRARAARSTKQRQAGA